MQAHTQTQMNIPTQVLFFTNAENNKLAKVVWWDRVAISLFYSFKVAQQEIHYNIM